MITGIYSTDIFTGLFTVILPVLFLMFFFK